MKDFLKNLPEAATEIAFMIAAIYFTKDVILDGELSFISIIISTIVGLIIGRIVFKAGKAVMGEISFMFWKKALYTRTKCSVCGEETGFKGNKRFKLVDGYVCQPCAEKTTPKDAFVATYGPNAFNDCTVEKIKDIIKQRVKDVDGG